jgi:hypothetical protein
MADLPYTYSASKLGRRGYEFPDSQEVSFHQGDDGTHSNSCVALWFIGVRYPPSPFAHRISPIAANPMRRLGLR